MFTLTQGQQWKQAECHELVDRPSVTETKHENRCEEEYGQQHNHECWIERQNLAEITTGLLLSANRASPTALPVQIYLQRHNVSSSSSGS